MRTLVSVAVFGLVPVPSMQDTVISSRGSNLRAPCENVDLSQLLIICDPITERLLDREELARIREALEAIAKQAA